VEKVKKIIVGIYKQMKEEGQYRKKCKGGEMKAGVIAQWKEKNNK
jgi:hypothetical protein